MIVASRLFLVGSKGMESINSSPIVSVYYDSSAVIEFFALRGCKLLYDLKRDALGRIFRLFYIEPVTLPYSFSRSFY